MIIDFRVQITICLAITAVVFLPVLIAVIWNKKRIAGRQIKEDKYWMRPPTWQFIAGMIGTLFFYIITIAMVFVADADMMIVAICLCVTFFYEYCSFAFLFWEIKVETDALTIYRPPLPRKYIKFHDITNVRYVEDRLLGQFGAKTRLFFYHNEKKLFDVGDSMSGFYQLLETFASKGKLERGYLKADGIELNEFREEFSVRETDSNKIRAAVCLAFFGGIFIAMIINWEELLEEASNSELFCYAVCLLSALMGLTDFLNAMLRKITVTYRTISIRNSIGRVKTYSIEEITEVVEKENFIILFRGDKKIAKISKDDKNFALLEERLRRIFLS
ncbi:MAG: hypothetical protein HDR27_08475 [Lachnospiraceae bacterium]|nr:hypothetical protein [Lachnospiraceae bacterium]